MHAALLAVNTDVMNRLYVLFIAVLSTLSFQFSSLKAQDLSLTFTSITDAKFYVYLNGKLQNERSSGMVTLRGLEDKEYHVRIVIDDPYEVAVTRKIKPDKKHSEYTVQFNAVRERVYLKAVKASKEETVWQPEERGEEVIVIEPETEKPKPAAALKRNSYVDTVARGVVNQIRTKIVVE